MNYWKILLVCSLFLGCKNSVNTEDNTSMDTVCVPVIDGFFKTVESGNYKGAIDELLSSNENIQLKDSGTIDMKNKFSAINELSGTYRGKSLLKKKSIQGDIAIYSYLVKYDKKFYRFVFEFYNNGVKTKIYKFLFDDNLEIELEESLKLYI